MIAQPPYHQAQGEAQDTPIYAQNVSALGEPLMGNDKHTHDPHGHAMKKGISWRNLGMGACATCYCLFFLLFFLIPRSPYLSGAIDMYAVDGGGNGASSNHSFVMAATYSLYNPNPYQLTINSLNTNLETETLPEGVNDQIYIISAVGYLSPGQETTVSSNSWLDLTVWYNFNQTSNSRVAITKNYAQCCAQYSSFETTGDIDTSTWLVNKDVSIGTKFAVVSCCS